MLELCEVARNFYRVVGGGVGVGGKRFFIVLMLNAENIKIKYLPGCSENKREITFRSYRMEEKFN